MQITFKKTYYDDYYMDEPIELGQVTLEIPEEFDLRQKFKIYTDILRMEGHVFCLDFDDKLDDLLDYNRTALLASRIKK